MGVAGLIKRLVNACLSPLDAEVVRNSEQRGTQAQRSRLQLKGALEHLQQLGFSPATVIDVGAGVGTPALFEVFPEARHLWVEPLEENRARLEQVARGLRQVEIIAAAACPTSGNVRLNVHPDLLGSSLYPEEEDSDVNGVERVVPGVTLDDLARERATTAPYLLKLDIQGAELDALAGAAQVLSETQAVV